MLRAARLFAACLLLLVGGAVRAQPGVERLVPPSPAPNGFIADGGPVLDPQARDRLNARIAAVQRETGGDIGVAILRDLEGRAPGRLGGADKRGGRLGRGDARGAARRTRGARRSTSASRSTAAGASAASTRSAPRDATSARCC